MEGTQDTLHNSKILSVLCCLYEQNIAGATGQHYEFYLGRGRESGAGYRKLHVDDELKISLHKWDSMR